MKQRSEERAAAAVKTLIHSIGRYLEDIETILDEFEATHTEYECDRSKTYDALMAAYSAMETALIKIHKPLKK